MGKKILLLFGAFLILASCSYLGSAWNKTKNFYGRLVYSKSVKLDPNKYKLDKVEEKFAFVFSNIDEEIEKLLHDLDILNRKDVFNKDSINRLTSKYVWLEGYIFINNKGFILASSQKGVQFDVHNILKESQKNKGIFAFVKKNGRSRLAIARPFFYNRKLIGVLVVYFEYSALASFFPESKDLLVIGKNNVILWKGENVPLIDNDIKRLDLFSLAKKNIKGQIVFDKKRFFYFVRYIGLGKIIYCTVI